MSQPTWITKSGSLGVIPEQVFYQQNMLASTPVIEISNVISSSSITNEFTTAEPLEHITRYVNVIFTGTVFGGVEPNVRYFVLDTPTPNSFRICIDSLMCGNNVCLNSSSVQGEVMRPSGRSTKEFITPSLSRKTALRILISIQLMNMYAFYQ